MIRRKSCDPGSYPDGREDKEKAEMGKQEESFYRGRKILVTGHTGFKGAWLCAVLHRFGAEVTGYALEPPTAPSLFELAGMGDRVHSVLGDIRDLDHLKEIFFQVKPQIVIHMAAQPIVRESYRNPVDTYATNVMGTVNVLECVRLCDSVRSVLNVTTDKVYQNREWEWGYRENEELCGFDPYSNSKSCSELVTTSYRNSFFTDGRVAVSTARAGNVIGGGDFAADRIIPDCVRAIEGQYAISLRNPGSIRPYQHVLEAIGAYLLIVKRQFLDGSISGSYNVGPDEESCIRTLDLVQGFGRAWQELTGQQLLWECPREYCQEQGFHEAGYLKLDNSKIRSRIGWKPRWGYEEMLRKTAELTRVYLQEADVWAGMERQIEAYFQGGFLRE